MECSDNLYTQRNGVITSADFPSPYPKSSDCLYRIELEEGFFITLNFEDSFDVEDHPEVTCPYDHIKVSWTLHTPPFSLTFCVPNALVMGSKSPQSKQG